MTENNIPSFNLLLSLFFGMKGNITTGFLRVGQCLCQQIGQSTGKKALFFFFPKEHIDESYSILISVICAHSMNDTVILSCFIMEECLSRSFASLCLQ